MSGRIHVVAAVITDTVGNILIARRPLHVHQGGLWEFPGGKLEPGETVEKALHRELQEELGIRVTHCHPLLAVSHDYHDKSVLLDIWRVTAYNGRPSGMEQQDVRWCSLETIDKFEFPPANRAVIERLKKGRQLPQSGKP